MNLPTTAANAAAASAAAASQPSDRARLSDSFDTFLLLLTTQLRNQDPTNPMDSSQFTEQLVQYSQVEQQIETNDMLKGLVEAQSAATVGAALGMMGKSVLVSSPRAELANGEASWTYELPETASAAELIVRDAVGREIGRAPAERAAGRHEFTWGGQDSRGQTAPDGVYTLEVRAFASDDQQIPAKIYSETRVTGVETGGSSGVKLATPLGPHDFSTVLAVTN